DSSCLLERAVAKGSSERRLEREAQGAAVAEERGEAVLGGDGAAVVAIAAEIVDVLEIEAVLLVHVGADAEGVVAEALVAAEDRRGVARQADRVRRRCREIDARQHLEP